MAASPARSINHLVGPFPTSYTRDCRCLDASVVLGNWLSKANVSRTYSWTYVWTRVSHRQSVRMHRIYRSCIVKSWASVCVCFYLHVSDLLCTCRTHAPGAIIRDTGLRLNNVTPLSVVLLLLMGIRSKTNGYTTITTQLWIDVLTCSDPNGCLGSGAARGPRTWKLELSHGSEQPFVIWHIVELLAQLS